MYVNLLPTSTRLCIQFDRQLRIYLKLWMALGSIAVIHFTYQLIDCRAAKDSLASLDVECEPVRRLQAKIEQQRQGLTGLESSKSKLKALQSADRPLSILATVVQAIANQPQHVHLQRLSIQANQLNNTSPNPGQQVSTNPSAVAHPLNRPGQTVVMMGQAEDETALARFVADLRYSGWLEMVELKSSSRASNTTARQFHIEAWHMRDSSAQAGSTHYVKSK